MRPLIFSEKGGSFKPQLLVVEDDADSQDLLKILLESEGYDVIRAMTGAEAMEIYSRSDTIRLVLLDLMLPDMSGMDVCKSLKSSNVNRFTPVLMLTARSEIPDQVFGLNIGADEYITKPFINDVLLAKIHALLRIKDLMDFQICVLDSIDSALLSLDVRGQILSMNLKSREYFGLSSEDIGKNIGGLLRGFQEGLILDKVKNVCEKGAMHTLTNIIYEAPESPGSRKYFNLRCFPLAASPQEKYAVVLLDEVTKRVILQNRLVASSKNTLLGDITKTLAHNINNPLTSVFGRVEYLLSKIQPEQTPEFIVKNLKNIHEHLIKVLEIIRDVSSFAGGRELATKKVNIHEILDKALALTDHELACQGIDIELEYDKSIPPSRMDENAMEEAIINIILNAKDSMGHGGALKITSKNENNNAMKIMFTDSGCGIPEQDQAYVFDLFYSKKESNIGLGLTTVARVIQEHGGSVGISSKINSGTTVTLELPIR